LIPGARDLIAKLLQKKPENRMPLLKVMEHPWIVEHTSKK
jgi:serine/threonine protein kinase